MPKKSDTTLLQHVNHVQDSPGADIWEALKLIAAVLDELLDDFDKSETEEK